MKEQKLVKKLCEQCGAEMIVISRRRFCDACNAVRKVAANQRNAMKRRIDYSQQADIAVARDVRRAFHEVTNDNLQDWFNHHRHDSNIRPEWCSPARWRIFLRWVANSTYYRNFGQLHAGQARGIATTKINPIYRNY